MTGQDDTGDFQGFPAKFEDWAKSPVTAIERFYELTIGAAQQRVDWYNNKAGAMGGRSRRLRGAAIISGTIGTLLPLIHAASGGGTGNATGTWGALGAWGYVALALAGAFLAADRAFGFSSSWIRFRTAEVRIGKLIAAYHFDWAIEMSKLAGRMPDADESANLLQVQRAFVTAVEDAAEEETQDWIREFKSSLTEMAKAYRKEELPAAKPPGMIDVSIANAGKADEPVEVLVDYRSVGTAVGGGLQISQVVPGPHSVQAKGKISGKEVSASAAVEVVSSSIAAVSLTLG